MHGAEKVRRQFFDACQSDPTLMFYKPVSLHYSGFPLLCVCGGEGFHGDDPHYDFFEPSSHQNMFPSGAPHLQLKMQLTPQKNDPFPL